MIKNRFYKAISRLLMVLVIGSAFVHQNVANGKEVVPPFLLLVFCEGGWDQTMVFDSKIGVSNISQESGAVLDTETSGIHFVGHANRPSVKNFFAKNGDRTVIINGVFSESMGHKTAIRDMLGLYLSKERRYTDWISYYAAGTGNQLSFPHLVIDSINLAGYHSGVAVGLTTNIINEFSQPIDDSPNLGNAAETGMTKYLKWSYANLLEKQLGSTGIDSEKIYDFTFGYYRENSLKTLVPQIMENSSTASDSGFLKNSKLALEFFKRGLSKTATIRNGDGHNWDTHLSNYTLQSARYEYLFSDLDKIITYATTLGIQDNLMLIVMSEFGRSPRLNSSKGKDHWPYTSVLLWGKDLNGGSIVGRTDDYLRGVPTNPIFGSTTGEDLILFRSENIFAAIFTKYKVSFNKLRKKTLPLTIIME